MRVRRRGHRPREGPAPGAGKAVVSPGLLARVRNRLTYANVMSSVAAFLALGGTAQAIIIVNSKNLAKNSVGASEIKTGAVGLKELSKKVYDALLMKAAGAISATPMAIAPGGDFNKLAAKGIIVVDGKSNLLLVGQVSLEDADRMSSIPPEVQVQFFLDGMPVGGIQPCVIPDNLSSAVPISALVGGVGPGEHTVEIGVAVMTPTGVSAEATSLSAVAMKA